MDVTTIAALVVVGAIALFSLVMSLFVTSVSKGTVTQLTSASTAVTLNKEAGVITTVSLTNAANASVEFQVNNSSVKADSVVLATISYDGAVITERPVVSIRDVAAGSFSVTITNFGATTLTAPAAIHFHVI